MLETAHVGKDQGRTGVAQARMSLLVEEAVKGEVLHKRTCDNSQRDLRGESSHMSRVPARPER